MMTAVSDSSSTSLPDLHPARPCVYLDQWVWIRLARASKGGPQEAFDVRVLAAVQDAAEDGVAFPLSTTHYIETSKITNPRQRLGLARTMASISHCRTLRARKVLLRHQMLYAMHLTFGRPAFRPQPPEVLGTGIRWAFDGEPQRTHGQAAAEWLRSSGVAGRMLDDVCQAVEASAEWFIGGNGDRAREVIEEFPRVFSSCDELGFDEAAQALAYLIIHLPDRYCRQFQVLERLLTSGYLPMGKSDSFAVIDIGAGPGPGIFATRSFYAALAHYAAQNHPLWQVATLGFSDVVERSKAMPHVMHWFAEALVLAEQGLLHPEAGKSEPNPCIEELRSSSAPFGARFDDFTTLDVGGARRRAQRQAAKEIYDEDVLEMSWGQTVRPRAYALAIMMNFLTWLTGDAPFLRGGGPIDDRRSGARGHHPCTGRVRPLLPGAASLMTDRADDA
jgi:hypothetical protein